MSKGELTRQRIIEEAAPIFNQKGFAGCSMQDVMEATGLEKGGLYRHFTGKEELAVEAFRYAIGLSVKTRTDNLEHIEGAVAKLRYFVKRFVETPSRLPGGCPLMNTAIDADDGNPALRGLAKEAIQQWRARLCVIVEAGIESNEIRRKTDSRRIANTMIATLEGALMISRIEGTKDALHDAQATLESVLDEITAD